MQSTQDANLGLEIAKLAIPVLATFIAGWWITRSIEKYKTELAKQFLRFQNLHLKRLDASYSFLKKAKAIETDLLLEVKIAEDFEFYLGNQEHQRLELSPVTKRVGKMVRELRGVLDDERMFFDKNDCDAMEDLINNMEIASRSFLIHYSEESDRSWIPALEEPEKLAEAKKMVQSKISSQRANLETRIRKIVTD